MISSDKAGVQFPDSELSFAVVLDSGWMAFVQELSMAVLEGVERFRFLEIRPFSVWWGDCTATQGFQGYQRPPSLASGKKPLVAI
jgi:hypothetical protein